MAKPKLALIPSAQGSKFYSVLPSSGVGDFNFTRSGSATRINSQGLIESVANGVSRLNYPMIDGVVKGCPHHILEPQRTNGLRNNVNSDLYSTQLITLSNNQGISPDGTLNAFKAVPTTVSNHHLFFRTGMGNIADTFTQSVYAKADGYDFCYIRFDSPTNYVFFDLVNGIVAFSDTAIEAKIENVGNGWFRCIATMTTTSYANAVLGVSDNGQSATMTGDGSSGVLFYGHQSELGDYETSLIITPTDASVTRSAETANGSGDASTFNDSEGVLMVEASAFEGANTDRQIAISDGGTSNRIVMAFLSNNTQIQFVVVNGGPPTVNSTRTIDTITDLTKITFSYKVNDFKVYVNGFLILTDTNGAVPSGLNELAFDRGDGADNFYGNTKQIQYFDTALTDSELEQLTSWVSFQDMAEGQLYTIE